MNCLGCNLKKFTDLHCQPRRFSRHRRIGNCATCCTCAIVIGGRYNHRWGQSKYCRNRPEGVVVRRSLFDRCVLFNQTMSAILQFCNFAILQFLIVYWCVILHHKHAVKNITRHGGEKYYRSSGIHRSSLAYNVRRSVRSSVQACWFSCRTLSP